ncbi:MAG: hypothetical protein P4L99_14350 [Chthoniobacter sp.]|nr:hypothetical protein [Chthoniobacter sp.]
MHDARRARSAFPRPTLKSVVDWLFAAKWRLGHWVVALLWLAAMLAVQWKVGQGFITQANQNVTQYNQDAYLGLAKANLPFVWPAFTDGIRTPLFPFLIKAWASDDNAQFFAAAKQANVCFGLIATALLAFYFWWKLPLLPALNVGTISALIILPASVFVTAEAVYYTAFFFFWVVGWRLLVENPLRSYALAGLLCAATYLAKPSTLLLSVCLVALSLVRWIQVERSGTEDITWTGRRFLIGAVVFYVSFLVPVLPKAYDMYQRAGDPFQNASEYCFWMDDWQQCIPRLRDFSANKVKQMPPAERPSAVNYWQHHTRDQIWNRMTSGMLEQAHNLLFAEKSLKNFLRPGPQLRIVLPVRGAYLVALLLGTLLLATQGATGKSRTQADRRTLWALAALGFTAHFLAISFYTPITGGDRLILAIYIPVLFSLAMGIEYLREERSHGWRVAAVQLIHLLIAGQLVWQLVHLSTVATFGEPRGAM